MVGGGGSWQGSRVRSFLLLFFIWEKLQDVCDGNDPIENDSLVMGKRLGRTTRKVTLHR